MIWSILVKTWVGQKENIISFCSVGKPLMQSAYCFFFSKTQPHLITMRVFIIYQMLKIILTIRQLYYDHINHIHSICAYYVAVTVHHCATRIYLALHIWCKNLQAKIFSFLNLKSQCGGCNNCVLGYLPWSHSSP